nr:RHS repeat-associated core domain-containing protein [Xanthomonas sp. SHU 199]
MSNFQGIHAVLHLMAAVALSLLVAFGASAQTVRYIHTDGLGSVVLITDEHRNTVERSEYEPYGYLLNRPITNSPGYTGHVMDAATGLTYMQQRYFDAQVGSFLSVDPVLAIRSPVENFNRYRYANGNPYKFIDVDGRNAAEQEPEPVKNLDPITVVAKRDLSSQASYSAILTFAPVRAVAVIPEAIEIFPWLSSTVGAGVMGPFLFFMSPDPCGAAACGEIPGYWSKMSDVPSVGPPGEWIDGRRRSRLYGPDGRPKVDIDNPHQGAPYPHVHEWENGEREHPGREIPDLPPPPVE